MALFSRALINMIALKSAVHTTMVAALQTEGAQPFSRSLEQPVVPFNHTCTVGSYSFDANSTTLGIYCNNDDVKSYAYDWSLLDLDLCIANNDGALVSSPGGNFSDTCSNCTVTWSHVYLTPVTTTFTATPHMWITATVTSVSTPRWDDLYLGCGGCSDRADRMPSATVDLNKVVTNANGTIGCHTFKGTTMDAKPDSAMRAETTTLSTMFV
ncbi:unnamed protein product [Discula destructiva]